MAKDYDVGYGKPPVATRFRKGQSGNPKGRPRGTRNLKTDLAEELAECVPIKEGEQARRVSKQRALVKRLTAKALQGDTRAATVLLKLIERLLDPDAAPEPALVPEDQALLAEYVARQAGRREGGDE